MPIRESIMYRNIHVLHTSIRQQFNKPHKQSNKYFRKLTEKEGIRRDYVIQFYQTISMFY